MELWVATTNKGKVTEFKSLLGDLGIEIKTLKDLPNYYSPEETGTTFAENAWIKAHALKALKPDAFICAEDSGLEVTGLNNLPGVHSARYAGDKASDAMNNDKVLKMVNMRTPQNREAQFKCALAFIDPKGYENLFEGTVEGAISKKLSGTEGFGYDCCFIPTGKEQTFAELGLVYKNKVSHRSQAIKKFREYLKSIV